MKPRLLNYLRCPSCDATLDLASVERREDAEIIEGQLVCSARGCTFYISRGIPRFTASDQLEGDKGATAENFGWQWQHFTHGDDLYAEQFLGWITPVRPDFFRDKVVLEGGCGKGRHTQLAAEWGARDVVGVDLSAAVETAFANTRHLENAHVIQADIYKLPLARAFDYAFSVGVLHHLPHPETGFRSLLSKVKAGGHLSAWVYGAENNEWIIRWINPLRERFTSRLNKRVLLHLSKLPTLALFLLTKTVYGPLNRSPLKGVAQRLFYNEYLTGLSRFGWREQHTIVFDHLVAPTAYYLSRDEFGAWWNNAGTGDVVVNWHNENSWCGFGRVNL